MPFTSIGVSVAGAMSRRNANAAALAREIDWFSRVLAARIGLYFEQSCEFSDIYHFAAPDIADDDSDYGRFVRTLGLTFDERIVLMLALIPHVRPQALDTFFIHNKNLERGFTEFGGWKGKCHGGFLPTCETALFVLAGHDLNKRFEASRLFEEDHLFLVNDVLRIGQPGDGEPLFSGALTIAPEYLNRLTSGIRHKPDYSTTFPAKRITTKLGWEDLVLPVGVREEIENINAWIEHAAVLLDEWGLEKTIKPGYRSLFYGPPGTGKTLTATLIGVSAGMDVYRIDLSMVVSKYIGETEKNLAGVFDQAARKHWILFFDEADALFGKRTQTTSANDRYANQEVAYLLQRIEDFPGVVILATNLKANIDEAFARRFQSLIYFPMPDTEHRLKLWNVAFNGGERLSDDVDLVRIAEDYPLSGGAIANVVRFSALSALQQGRQTIGHDDLVKGVTKELRKEGKTV